MKSILAFFKKLHRQLFEIDIGNEPFRDHFPNIGADGEITIDCIITPCADAYSQQTLADQKRDGVIAGIPRHCVGALVVEVSEFGLRMVWKPAKALDKSLLSPFPYDKPTDKKTDPNPNGAASRLSCKSAEEIMRTPPGIGSRNQSTTTGAP